nr:putative integron gene cassette protein [uncultured bacterium]CAS02632.1 putative integron gene cassette protein [uncultured bacterium]
MTAIIVASAQTDLGFSYRATAKGVVHIARDGREVVILRAKAASQFLAKAEGASMDAVQQLCARVTGNYKRGNEATAASVRRSKGRYV